MTTARGTRLTFAMFVNDVPLPHGVTPSREGKVLGRLCEIVYEHADELGPMIGRGIISRSWRDPVCDL